MVHVGLSMIFFNSTFFVVGMEGGYHFTHNHQEASCTCISVHDTNHATALQSTTHLLHFKLDIHSGQFGNIKATRLNSQREMKFHSCERHGYVHQKFL